MSGKADKDKQDATVYLSLLLFACVIPLVVVVGCFLILKLTIDLIVGWVLDWKEKRRWKGNHGNN